MSKCMQNDCTKHFSGRKVWQFKKNSYLCTAFEAQMAESVDALVSNTSGATRAGSTPALGTNGKRLEEAAVSRLFCVIPQY